MKKTFIKKNKNKTMSIFKNIPGEAKVISFMVSLGVVGGIFVGWRKVMTDPSLQFGKHHPTYLTRDFSNEQTISNQNEQPNEQTTSNQNEQTQVQSDQSFSYRLKHFKFFR